MQILRPILRLLRHPNLAASPAPMHHLSSPLRFFMESATNRWWPPALARRVSPLMMSPIPPAANRVFRQPRNMATISRVGGYGSGSDEDGSGSDALEDHELGIIVSDGEELFAYSVLEDSRHRDGSIYTAGMDIWWKQEYSIVDRNETRLQEMPLSYPCVIYDGTCLQHVPRHMLQIVSLKLSKIPVDGGLVQLYGYIAVRDCLDPLLNYVVNISRDEPIILEKGSLINMAGPKRGIDLISLVLIEYDMRIKAGEQEKDDLQLIDGVSIIGNAGDWNYPPFTIRIAGDCGGAVDLTVTRIDDAFEATVQVFISEVQCSFNLSLGCLTSGLNKEIWLFDGAIAESCSLKTSVVAVAMDCLIDLKFKLGSSSDQHCCSFESKTHGHDTQEIKTDFALISVKVSWSALP